MEILVYWARQLYSTRKLIFDSVSRFAISFVFMVICSFKLTEIDAQNGLQEVEM